VKLVHFVHSFERQGGFFHPEISAFGGELGPRLLTLLGALVCIRDESYGVQWRGASERQPVDAFTPEI
jgi:hypothetical protein